MHKNARAISKACAIGFPWFYEVQPLISDKALPHLSFFARTALLTYGIAKTWFNKRLAFLERPWCHSTFSIIDVVRKCLRAIPASNGALWVMLGLILLSISTQVILTLPLSLGSISAKEISSLEIYVKWRDMPFSPPLLSLYCAVPRTRGFPSLISSRHISIES